MVRLRDENCPLAELVATELARRGRSRRWLARRLGVSPQCVNNIVNGERPAVQTLRKLSNFLHEPLGLLMQLAGIAPAEELAVYEGVVPVADDWPTLRMLRIMRGVSHATRARLLQVIELWLEDRCCSEAAEPEMGGVEALAARATT